jgi:Carbohydrate family 9 binding domain-like
MTKAVGRVWRTLLRPPAHVALLALLTAAGLLAAGGQAARQDAPTVKRAVECRWAPSRIDIDGRINEKAWDAAEVVKDFVVFWQNRKARTATEARLLWDDRFLYFMAEMEDADLYAVVKEHNGMTWYDDVFELFFKPSLAKGNRFPLQYYELQVNALNTQLELFLPSRGAGGYARFAAGSKFGMKSAVRLRGTLNDWNDRDEGWTVEGAIPWSAFKAAGGKPTIGARWKFALCRYDYSVTLERTELSSTAPLTAPDFHRYEDYGDLIFVGPK